MYILIDSVTQNEIRDTNLFKADLLQAASGSMVKKCLPSGYTATEHVHRHSGFSHETWSFSIALGKL